MTLFAVTSYGGEWEDSWEHLIGVCPTLEIAEALKAKVESQYPKTVNIPSDLWNMHFYDAWDSLGDEDGIEEQKLIDYMCKALPEYSKTDVEQAYKLYESSYNDFHGVLITEINLFQTISDVTNYNGIIY